MATRKLLTNGNAFKRTDGRWGGTVWYMDESGERKRKCFSGTTKQEVNKKMTAYIEDFNNQIATSIEANKTLKDSRQVGFRFKASSCLQPVGIREGFFSLSI